LTRFLTRFRFLLKRALEGWENPLSQQKSDDFRTFRSRRAICFTGAALRQHAHGKYIYAKRTEYIIIDTVA
jgi:hypothetical protein